MISALLSKPAERFLFPLGLRVSFNRDAPMDPKQSCFSRFHQDFGEQSLSETIGLPLEVVKQADGRETPHG